MPMAGTRTIGGIGWWKTARPGGIDDLAGGAPQCRHRTLSVWAHETAMRAYLISEPRLKAMKVFRAIATGRTLGFTAETPPDWSAVHDLWPTEGRKV